MHQHDRGSGVAASLLWIGLALILVVGVGRVGTAGVDAARADSAADAAALAAAASSDAAAHRMAARNGATVVSIERDGAEVQVRVRLGRAHSVARAERIEIRRPERRPLDAASMQ